MSLCSVPSLLKKYEKVRESLFTSSGFDDDDDDAKIFRRRENFLDDAKSFEKIDRVDAIDFVQKSSKSELSSRFLGRFKFRTTNTNTNTNTNTAVLILIKVLKFNITNVLRSAVTFIFFLTKI